MKIEINFERVFSSRDQDRIVSIGIEGMKLYIKHHCRERAVKYSSDGHLRYIPAHDENRSYVFINRMDLEKIFKELSSNPEQIIWNNFKRDVRKYVPTVEGVR